MSQVNPTDPIPNWVWISIKCGDDSLLLVSRDGTKCQIISLKDRFVSGAHPVENLCSLRDALAKVRNLKTVFGHETVKQYANYGRLVHAHSKLQKKR